MRRRRSLVTAFAAGIALATLGACNAITGAHDRFLEQPDESPDPTKHKDSGTQDGGVDARPVNHPDAGDAGPTITTIDIPINPTAQWSSPNMATAGYDGGTVIATFHGPHDNHPMLVPFPTQTVPNGKYTVRARIFAHEKAEYGIFVRGHNVANGFGVFVLSSRYSSAEELNSPFLAPLTTAKTDDTNDDPPGAGVANGQGYAFEPEHTWIFQIEVDGENLHGTITREDQPSITSDMKLTDTTPAGDRGTTFGFYGFQTPNAALLQLQLIY
jgi:hypothetical protein